jgi:hypothetical protein
MRKEFPIREVLEILLKPPFSRGEFRFSFSESIKKAILPLKKGGREGFLGEAFLGS